MTTTAPEISDEEIRDWAKSTGRKIGDRGRIPVALRTEYEGIAREMQAPPEGDPAEAVPDEPEAPKAARAESKPRATPRPRARRPRSRFRAWITGAPAPGSSSKKRARKEAPPRKPLDKFAGKVWGGLADAAEHFNVPIARCMEWQSPYVGQLAEETISGTFLDRIVQPIARGEEKLTTAAAVLFMPLIVGALQSPQADPERGPLGVVTYQLLSKALDECVETQLEVFGADTEVGERIRKSAEERAELKRKTAAVVDMIFAQIPDPKTADEAAAAAKAESERRQTAADAARDYVHRPGAPVIRGSVVPEPDNRGQAAEKAAAAMAAQGEAAAQAAAVANVQLGTARF